MFINFEIIFDNWLHLCLQDTICVALLLSKCRLCFVCNGLKSYHATPVSFCCSNIVWLFRRCLSSDRTQLPAVQSDALGFSAITACHVCAAVRDNVARISPTLPCLSKRRASKQGKMPNRLLQPYDARWISRCLLSFDCSSANIPWAMAKFKFETPSRQPEAQSDAACLGLRICCSIRNL